MFKPWLIGAMWFCLLTIPSFLLLGSVLGRAGPDLAGIILFLSFGLSSVATIIHLIKFYRPLSGSMRSRNSALFFACILPFAWLCLAAVEDSCELTDDAALSKAREYANKRNIDPEIVVPSSYKVSSHCEYHFEYLLNSRSYTILVFGDGPIRSQPTP